jgi:hypothetical protein
VFKIFLLRLRTEVNVREQIVKWFRDAYERRGRAPSIRELRRKFRLSNRELYSLFPEGLRQICNEAKVPIESIKERLNLTVKAIKAKKVKAETSKVAQIVSTDEDWFSDLIPREEKEGSWKFPPPEIEFSRALAIELYRELKWISGYLKS